MVALIAALSFVLWYFLGGTTVTKTSNEITKKETSYLLCNGSDNKDYNLLSGTDYTGSDFEIRIIFINGEPSNYTFIVSKQFADEESARVYSNKLQANYNIYVGENNIDRHGLLPSYSHVDNVGKMTLSVVAAAINNLTAPLVLLDRNGITATVPEDFKAYFENIGFTCTSR